ncbi:MAG: type II secretion system F family protein, partial [Planctomycetota bacterium]
RSGLPLEQGLLATADEAGRSRLAQWLRATAAGLAQGKPLDELVTGNRCTLPPHVAEMLVSAVRSQRVPEMLDALVRLERERRELTQRSLQTLAYPLLLLAVLLGFFALAAGWVVPQFDTLFKEFEAKVPPLTEAVISISGSKGLWVTGVVFALTIAYTLLLMVPGLPGKAYLFDLLPVVGSSLRWLRLSGLCRIAGALVEQGVALPDALRWAGEGTGDHRLTVACRRAALHIERGESAANAVASRFEFPRTLPVLLEWGEKHNALGEAFASAGDFYAQRSRDQSRLLTMVTAPLMLIVVIGCASLFFGALYGPMISLIQRLTG